MPAWVDHQDPVRQTDPAPVQPIKTRALFGRRQSSRNTGASTFHLLAVNRRALAAIRSANAPSRKRHTTPRPSVVRSSTPAALINRLLTPRAGAAQDIAAVGQNARGTHQRDDTMSGCPRAAAADLRPKIPIAQGATVRRICVLGTQNSRASTLSRLLTRAGSCESASLCPRQ